MFQPLSLRTWVRLWACRSKWLSAWRTAASPPERDRAALEMAGQDRLRPGIRCPPLRRLVQREIGDRLARGILSGAIHDGDTVTVDVNPDVASDGLSVTSEREQKAEN